MCTSIYYGIWLRERIFNHACFRFKRRIVSLTCLWINGSFILLFHYWWRLIRIAFVTSLIGVFNQITRFKANISSRKHIYVHVCICSNAELIWNWKMTLAHQRWLMHDARILTGVMSVWCNANLWVYPSLMQFCYLLCLHCTLCNFCHREFMQTIAVLFWLALCADLMP